MRESERKSERKSEGERERKSERERERERARERERERARGRGGGVETSFRCLDVCESCMHAVTLSRECGTNKPGTARFWSWLEPISVRKSSNSFKLFPAHRESLTRSVGWAFAKSHLTQSIY